MVLDRFLVLFLVFTAIRLTFTMLVLIVSGTIQFVLTRWRGREWVKQQKQKPVLTMIIAAFYDLVTAALLAVFIGGFLLTGSNAALRGDDDITFIAGAFYGAIVLALLNMFARHCDRVADELFKNIQQWRAQRQAAAILAPENPPQ